MATRACSKHESASEAPSENISPHSSTVRPLSPALCHVIYELIIFEGLEPGFTGSEIEALLYHYAATVGCLREC